MKLEQISDHIWSLKTWMMFPIRVWLVKNEEGVTLVDAGMPYMSKKIMESIASLNGGPLKRILLTHGHSDHVGAAKAILDNENVPIYAHAIEIPYLEGQKPYPRRKKAEKGIGGHFISPLPQESSGQLKTIAGLNPYLTPGHSPGHVIYYHSEDQVILAGDLFTSKKGNLRKPMSIFTADMEEAVRSSAIIKELDAVHLEICHGGPVKSPGSQIDGYMRDFIRSDKRLP